MARKIVLAVRQQGRPPTARTDVTFDVLVPEPWVPGWSSRGREARVACTAEDVEVLFRAEYGRMCRAVARMLNDRDLAEQVVQDSFVVLYRNRSRVDYDGAAAYAWRTAVNKAITVAKRSRQESGLVDTATRQGLLPGEGASTWSYGKPDQAVDGAHVRALVAALPDDQKIVVVLHYFCDWPDERIAQTLRVRAVTVRSRLHRARKTLQKQLERVASDA